MTKAVADLADARAAIDRQIQRIRFVAEGSTASWRGAGGNALRTLMLRYETSANALQSAVATFSDLLAEQVQHYASADAEATVALNAAGSVLRG